MATKEAAEPVAATDNFVCPHCQKEIEAAKIVAAAASLMGKKGGSVKTERKIAGARKGGKLGGSVKSEKKARSSAENGKKGGRPRKPKPSTSAETQS